MPTSDAQKRANEKWRANNKEKFDTSRKASTKLWRKKHKDEYLKKNSTYVDTYTMKWKDYHAETRRFRKILFDGFVPIE